MPRAHHLEQIRAGAPNARFVALEREGRAPSMPPPQALVPPRPPVTGVDVFEFAGTGRSADPGRSPLHPGRRPAARTSRSSPTVVGWKPRANWYANIEGGDLTHPSALVRKRETATLSPAVAPHGLRENTKEVHLETGRGEHRADATASRSGSCVCSRRRTSRAHLQVPSRQIRGQMFGRNGKSQAVMDAAGQFTKVTAATCWRTRRLSTAARRGRDRRPRSTAASEAADRRLRACPAPCGGSGSPRERGDDARVAAGGATAGGSGGAPTRYATSCCSSAELALRRRSWLFRPSGHVCWGSSARRIGSAQSLLALRRRRSLKRSRSMRL